MTGRHDHRTRIHRQLYGPAAPGITDYQTPARQMIGDFAPKLVALTDEVLFGDAVSLARELFDGGDAQ